jgi:hypothetical protein
VRDMNISRVNVFVGVLVLAVALISGGESLAATANADESAASTPAALLQLRESLRGRMATSPFKIPLIIESVQSSENIKGDVYAEIKHSFATVSAALAVPQVWCDILILHLNTKSCALQPNPGNPNGAPTLLMTVGKKVEQRSKDAYPIALLWKENNRKADFLQINLSADSGPLSTRNYRIVLEAVPTENGQTFIHLSYSYGFGATAKFLMKAYLNTVARDKVGFTVIGTQSTGEPIYVEGLLGLVERNTMRYHLAVEAYLGALRVPKAMQFEKRINDWFSAAERYPRQLREVDRSQYLFMKRLEFGRQPAPI